MFELLLRWFLYSLSIMFIAMIIPGIAVKDFASALWVTIILALVNAVIKPVLMFVSLPINFLTLGLFTFVINALLLLLVAKITPNFEIEGFLPALFGAIILSLLAILIGKI